MSIACDRRKEKFLVQFGASQAKKSQFFFEKGIDLDFRSGLKKTPRAIKTTKKRRISESLQCHLESRISHGFWPLFAYSHVTQDFRLQKNPNHVKGWVTSVSISGGKIVMQFSLDFVQSIKTEETKETKRSCPMANFYESIKQMLFRFSASTLKKHLSQFKPNS